MNEACNVKLFLSLPPGALGRGQKVKFHKFQLQSHFSKIFIPVPRGSFFSKHGHVAYQIDGDDKQNRMQLKFLSW